LDESDAVEPVPVDEELSSDKDKKSEQKEDNFKNKKNFDLSKVNMTDSQDVLHAAIKSIEADGYESLHPTPKKVEAPKPVNQMWENLYGIEEKVQKFEKDEKKFIKEEKPKVEKINKKA
jgi:hypothetical protein